ncbi:uncharacterized protein (TIGR00369 family) [Sphingomonas sp. PP-CE-3G-477]|uniref:PaaI family thioesterase n=1 Tax=Sphingomonas sp. PP-CE-3G-477 TaxID=2135660 RepID=UPI000D36424C|nr:PaaI family thioesterase [Sphingomonas sp. PP-CE-3G-477]PTQ66155.1 uncharacterized protein (TIGR00369 family) [Sphingomonas sp. PP-CE-3G-477]
MTALAPGAAQDVPGIATLRAMMSGNASPRINRTLGFALIAVEDGMVVFEGHPDQRVHTRIGTVHGCFAATMLDSACGYAVHSQLDASQGYTTLELKIAHHRPPTYESGPVQAEGRVISIGRTTAFAAGRLFDRHGRLCATATSTILIFPLE